MVPDSDPEALFALLRRARPVVLRGFAASWPARGFSLRDVVARATGGGEVLEPRTVEVQIGREGCAEFHGYGGVLERTPLAELPELAAREKAPLYLPQSPIWQRGVEEACTLRPLLKDLNLRHFFPSSGRSGPANKLESVNLWVSLGTTHSNLHYDSNHGLLVVLRGRKIVEVLAPAAAAAVNAFPIFDPLRAHHAAVPHACLMARLSGELGNCATDCTCPSAHEVHGQQATLDEGDAVFIPEGWWHHVLTQGTPDSSAAGSSVALAVNIWWRGYTREPASARPYVMRRLLGELLAEQAAVDLSCTGRDSDSSGCSSASHGRERDRSRSRGREKSDMSSDALATLVSAARRSRPPRHRVWRRAVAARSRTLAEDLGKAADDASAAEPAQLDSLHALLDGLDDAQASALLQNLHEAAADEVDGIDTAAALRRLWRAYPQRTLVAKWARHLHSQLVQILEDSVGLAGGSEPGE